MQTVANRELLDLFTIKGDQLCWVGAFQDYHTDVKYRDFDPSMDDDLDEFSRHKQRRQRISRVLNYAHHDVWACFGLVSRLDWMCGMARSGQLNDGRLRTWATLDIESFHTQLRSIYDYAAQAVVCADSGWNVDGNRRVRSFETLRKDLTKQEVQSRFDPQLASLILSASGFKTIRMVRDGIVHDGAHTMIFGEPAEGIRFQIYDASDHSLSQRGAMAGRTIGFEPYAVQALGSTLLFLEQLAQALHAKIPAERFGGRLCWSYGPGMDVLHRWASIFSALPGEWGPEGDQQYSG